MIVKDGSGVQGKMARAPNFAKEPICLLYLEIAYNNIWSIATQFSRVKCLIPMRRIVLAITITAVLSLYKVVAVL